MEENRKKRPIWKKLGIVLVVIACIAAGLYAYLFTGEKADSTGADIIRGDEGTHTLVVYFSRFDNMAMDNETDITASASLNLDGTQIMGNTEIVAHIIRQKTGADLYSIRVSTKYREAFMATAGRAWIEESFNMRPKLAGSPISIDDYDVIYVGYPIWFAYHNLIQCGAVAKVDE